MKNRGELGRDHFISEDETTSCGIVLFGTQHPATTTNAGRARAVSRERRRIRYGCRGGRGRGGRRTGRYGRRRVTRDTPPRTTNRRRPKIPVNPVSRLRPNQRPHREVPTGAGAVITLDTTTTQNDTSFRISGFVSKARDGTGRKGNTAWTILGGSN